MWVDEKYPPTNEVDIYEIRQAKQDPVDSHWEEHTSLGELLWGREEDLFGT
ncbi:hypothetical protein RintRC_1865 [Richelia intracellularis]|nr:hypothetical protein RintRC_1865 [Richelia intracellularis]